MTKTPFEMRVEAAEYRAIAAITTGSTMVEALLAVAAALEAAAAAADATTVRIVG